MKVYHLGKPEIEQLTMLPETGMGFQIVEAIWQGNLITLLVINSELALDLSTLYIEPSEKPATIAKNEARIIEALKEPRQTIIAAPGPHSFRLLNTRVQSTSFPAGRSILAARPSGLVKDDILTVPRTFHRFSAFNPDRRVDPKTGDFVPGTYAAPEKEVPLAPTGFAAVGRFALPNTLPASHHYVISAPPGTNVSFGTVAPAFSQSGGGVEAFFPNAVVNQVPRIHPSKISDE
ncbi:MAG TPA: hypothetical protein VGG20_15435 [Thermoanaerobaculia bacterium]|jgi:hypothetical protein